jgi:hypothetical protein
MFATNAIVAFARRFAGSNEKERGTKTPNGALGSRDP